MPGTPGAAERPKPAFRRPSSLCLPPHAMTPIIPPRERHVARPSGAAGPLRDVGRPTRSIQKLIKAPALRGRTLIEPGRAADAKLSFICVPGEDSGAGCACWTHSQIGISYLLQATCECARFGSSALFALQLICCFFLCRISSLVQPQTQQQSVRLKRLFDRSLAHSQLVS